MSNNIDYEEVAKFDDIAETWWDLDGDFAPLHRINPTRLDYIGSQCNGLFDKTALDVGCGGGILAESMAKEGALVSGIDAAENAIQVARLHAKSEQVAVDYIHTTAEPFAQSHAQQFEIVTCMEMLEHVPDPESVVAACCSLVQPGGKLFMSTLNRNLRAYLLGVVAAEYLLNLVPKGTHDHNKFIRPSELITMIERQGLIVRDIKGLHYNPLSQSAWLNQKPDVNYLLMAEKP